MGQHDLSGDWSEVRESVHRLRQTIPPDEAALRKAFQTWLKKVVLPRLGLSQEEVAGAETLEEVDTMLAEKIDRWNRELREKALEEGLQKGRQEGRLEGRLEGRQEERAEILFRQLRLKFGPLALEIEERVRSGDADRLLVWTDHILTAESLQEVFRN